MKCVVWYFRYKCVVSYLCNVGLGSEDVCGSVLEESPLRSSCSGGADCLLLVQLCLAFVVCPVRSYVTLFIVLLTPSTDMQPVLGCGMHLGRTAPHHGVSRRSFQHSAETDWKQMSLVLYLVILLLDGEGYCYANVVSTALCMAAP